MPRTDFEIIDTVVEDWTNGVLISIGFRAILWMVDAIRKSYGSYSSIANIDVALIELSDNAKMFRLDLKTQYLKEHPELDLPFKEENRLFGQIYANFHATLNHLEARVWWQERIPFSTRKGFHEMREYLALPREIVCRQQLSELCYELREQIRALGNILSQAPNEYTEGCVQWMCFQMAKTIPERLFNLVAAEASKTKVLIIALEQANEWMKRIAEHTHKCK